MSSISVVCIATRLGSFWAYTPAGAKCLVVTGIKVYFRGEDSAQIPKAVRSQFFHVCTRSGLSSLFVGSAETAIRVKSVDVVRSGVNETEWEKNGIDCVWK